MVDVCLYSGSSVEEEDICFVVFYDDVGNEIMVSFRKNGDVVVKRIRERGVDVEIALLESNLREYKY